MTLRQHVTPSWSRRRLTLTPPALALCLVFAWTGSAAASDEASPTPYLAGLSSEHADEHAEIEASEIEEPIDESTTVEFEEAHVDQEVPDPRIFGRWTNDLGRDEGTILIGETASFQEELPIPDMIVEAAARWEVDPGRMLRIAWCESRWDPAATGPGGAAGVFQFMPRTWGWASGAAGYDGYSPYNSQANIETAAWLLATQGPRHWTCI